jgi:hypothetical protein
VNGNEVRIPNYPFALEQFDLPVNYMHANAALSPSGADFQALDGFFRQRTGPWDSFLYWDQADSDTVQNAAYQGLTPTTGQNVIATGDGSTLAFQFYRLIGGAAQPIYNINGVTADATGIGHPPPSPAVKVYVAGSPVASGWTMSAYGMLTFATAPTGAIAVDCQYFKRVRFGEDFLDTSQFMQNLWRIKALKFQCVYA